MWRRDFIENPLSFWEAARPEFRGLEPHTLRRCTVRMLASERTPTEKLPALLIHPSLRQHLKNKLGAGFTFRKERCGETLRAAKSSPADARIVGQVSTPCKK